MMHACDSEALARPPSAEALGVASPGVDRKRIAALRGAYANRHATRRQSKMREQEHLMARPERALLFSKETVAALKRAPQ